MSKTSIDIIKSRKTGNTRYGNLFKCGNTWSCPVCSANINRRRSYEISSAVSSWQKQDNSILLLTLTAPHAKDDDLGIYLGKFSDARRKFFNHKPYAQFAGFLGIVGSITRLEINIGHNGWHPHTHQLLFLDNKQHETVATSTPDIVKSHFLGTLIASWRECCISSGLPAPSDSNGISIVNGEGAGYYLTKSERAIDTPEANSSTTAWHLLQSHLMTEDSLSAALFVEYANATKGKHQIFWSKGLRKLLRVGQEGIQQELSVQKADEDALLGALGIDDWRSILKHEKRWAVLNAAKEGGWNQVVQLIAEIRQKDVDLFKEKPRNCFLPVIITCLISGVYPIREFSTDTIVILQNAATRPHGLFLSPKGFSARSVQEAERPPPSFNCSLRREK